MPNIILEKFTRIGDRVVMRMSAENRSYNSSAPANGTRGTIAGYTTWIDYKEYNRPYGKPGRYHRWGAALVVWDGTLDPVTVSMHDISFEDRKFDKLRREDKAGNATVEAEVYLGPLPEVEYMPGDIVRIPSSRKWNAEHGDHIYITEVRYSDLRAKRIDGSPMPIYNGRYAYAGSGTSYYGSDEILELVKRGNYYHWFKGDRANLEFESLEKELNFYSSIGRVKEIPNPNAGNLYVWSLEDALKAVIHEEADVFSILPGMFGNRPSLRVSRIINMPELASRARAAIREGFATEIAELK